MKKIVLFLILLLFPHLGFCFNLPMIPKYKLDTDALIYTNIKDAKAIVIDKSEQKFFVYSFSKFDIKKEAEFECSTGKIQGAKTKEGDKKTPEGIYFTLDLYKDRDLTPIYGVLAFPLNYPNFIDKIKNRSGDAIWIHGTNKVFKHYDSNGCIVLENHNIKKIENKIKLNQTPVVIFDKITKIKKLKKKKIARKAIKLLNTWVSYLNKSYYDSFKTLYDYKIDIPWGNLANKIGSSKYFLADNILILKHEKVILLSFDIFLQDKTDEKIKEQLCTKRLYLSESKFAMKIIGDETFMGNKETNLLESLSTYNKNENNKNDNQSNQPY